jgi:hypothetical protein
MSFGIFAIGFVILIAGLTYAAYLLHVPALIVVGAIVMGIGILTGVKVTRQKDPVG